MQTTTMTTPDFAAITARQQATWASGDYSAIAARIPVISELLVDAADLRSGTRVLDVAGGSGNTALAAARSGCDVTSLDYVPSLLERGRQRAAAEGLPVAFVEGDAQAMPFPDAAFDAVISVVGVMFAADQEAAAREMLRVCAPGGTIALANWTPEGFIGGLFRTIGARVPPPAGVAPPPLWGTEDRVRELLGDGVREMAMRRRRYTFRFDSPRHFTDFFRQMYGPTLKAFAALDQDGRDSLEAEIDDLVRRFDRLGGDGPVAIPAEYLEVVATRA
jgi:SAM-dependent methyltransferase